MRTWLFVISFPTVQSSEAVRGLCYSGSRNAAMQACRQHFPLTCCTCAGVSRTAAPLSCQAEQRKGSSTGWLCLGNIQVGMSCLKSEMLNVSCLSCWLDHILVGYSELAEATSLKLQGVHFLFSSICSIPVWLVCLFLRLVLSL